MAAPEQPNWDLHAMGEIFGTQPEPVEDVAYGWGQRYTIGSDQALHLETYPDAQVTRVVSRDAKIELYRQEPPYLYPEGVVFERRSEGQRLQLFVPPNGSTVLDITHVTAPRPQESSPEPATVSSDSDSLPHQNTDVADDSGAPQTPSHDRSAVVGQQEQEEQPRLTLSGRVGASPSFRTTRHGILVAQFPLGVPDPDEDDTTTWHTIVAFKERAEKLKGSLKKGQPVEVIGYLHVTEQPAKGGTTKRIEQIYAVTIKPH